MNEVMIYTIFLVNTNIIATILLHLSFMQSLHIGIRIRIACSSLLCRKIIMRIITASMNQTYKMSTYFNILQLVVASYFPLGLILLSESILNFLLMDEVNTRCFSEKIPQLQLKSQKPQKATNVNNKNQTDRYISKNASILLFKHQRLSDLSVYVKLQHISADWMDTGQLSPTPDQLCAVVGVGKSSMLHLLLKELNPSMGSVILTQGSSKYNFPGNLSTGYFTNNPNLCISYASQESWLFDVTVRDNILFG
ncbi:hypothetical protein ALC56_04044 [Trachymyrmex septentrionalis]|uniref:ABC transporter domain-containing protein n=1 Tax=Trachymyrmex septentrionalis TaxID=34720 RepID=A0A151JYT3_9HYME|nr:hypothetical protein ALC56_04044 [Trachymyrmex septentrionalis]